MDEDFRRHTDRINEAQRDEDVQDFNNEMAGRDTGRMQRFGFEGKRGDAKIQEKRRKKALDELLLNAGYAALYQDTMKSLQETESLVYEARDQCLERIEGLKSSLQDTLGLASKMPDGSAVFRSQDGDVYHQDGVALENDALAGIDWHKGAPSWETYQERLDALKGEQDFLALMNAHDQRLGEIRVEMKDEENRPTEERVHKIKDEIENIIKDTQASNDLKVELEIQRPPPESAPNLGL